MNNNKQFISYTCPSILALNNCVQKIYRNKIIKKTPTKSMREENGLDLFYRNQIQKTINV